MPSRWNELLDRLLQEKLTVGEYRLVLALARLLLGWKRDGAYLGRALLRENAQLDGRSFDRAREGLVAKGLLRYTPGAVGKGNRGYYELTLQKAALQRPIETTGKAALQRPKAEVAKGRSAVSQKAALQRPRRGIGKVKTSQPTLQTPTLQRQAFDAYLGSGGTLELTRQRGALARAVTSAAKAGTPETEILAAARQLGRTREFPGLLKQQIEELRANGGPCEWTGLNRPELTPTQLTQCGCTHCNQWANALQQVPA